MKKFVVLYTSDAVAQGMSVADMIANTPPEQMEAGMAAWKSWYEKSAGAIVDLGAPLGMG